MVVLLRKEGGGDRNKRKVQGGDIIQLCNAPAGFQQASSRRHRDLKCDTSEPIALEYDGWKVSTSTAGRPGAGRPVAGISRALWVADHIGEESPTQPRTSPSPLHFPSCLGDSLPLRGLCTILSTIEEPRPLHMLGSEVILIGKFRCMLMGDST